MINFVYFISIFAVCSVYVNAEQREYTFHINWFNAAPDGVSREVLGINGMTPGPQITANVGDTIVVNVINWLNVSTTLHWHGMLQRASNEMDGVPHLTQRAISPEGGTFHYSFVADLPGTYWYHSHYSMQYTDGCRGALIIQDPTEPAYPEETLLLADWYHTPAEILMSSKYMTPESKGTEPVPDAALVNNIGQAAGCANSLGAADAAACRFFRTQLSSGSHYCSVSDIAAQITGEAPSSQLPTRLRLINGAALAAFNFSVEHHSLIVISVDGVAVHPTAVPNIILNTGQRYDAIVCRNQREDNKSDNAYMMRALFVSSVFDTSSPSKGAFGVLQYALLDTAAPLTRALVSLPSGYESMSSFESTSFVPLESALLPPPPSRREITLNIDFFPNPNTGITMGHFNKQSTVLPASSRGMTMLEAVRLNRTIPSSSMQDILVIYSDDHTQLVFNNHDDGNHPIHLHGHRFYVMGQGSDDDGPYDSSKHKLNYLNPTVRDTVTVNPLSWTVIRLLDKNPGVWFMHCHIDWHVVSGLAMVLVEYGERETGRCAENAL